MSSKSNKQSSLRLQITLIVLSLIFLTIAAIVPSFWYAVSTYSKAQNERRIENTSQVLQNYLNEKEKLLITSARVLTADFGFKQAVATRDEATINDVLTNHGRRINADLMSLVDLDGQMITTNLEQSDNSDNFFERLALNPEDGSTSQFITLSSRIYQVIILPVNTPRTIAYAVIGFMLDKTALDELKRVTGLDISLYAGDDILVTSLTTNAAAYQQLSLSQEPQSWSITFPDYQFRNSPFPKSDGLQLLLSASQAQEKSEFTRLLITILSVVFIVAIITVMVSAYLAKSVTRPLYQLVLFAREIGSGVFKKSSSSDAQSQELLELQNAFEKMYDEIKQREDEIQYRADHDHLTGLPNRQLIIKQLNDWSSDKQMIVVIMSIMNFRELNDAMGPTIGDATLKIFSERLTGYLDKSSNPLGLGRISDNNFLFMQGVNDSQTIQTSVSGLINYLSAPYQIEQFTVELNLSAGVMEIPNDGDDAITILRRLMIVSKSAKQSTDKLAYYQDGDDDKYLRSINLVDELRDNLQRDEPKLFMVYQPKLNLTTNKFDKVEALIRWINDDDEFVNPEEFISLAENSGLIVPLTRWVVKTVLRQLSEMEQAGYKMDAAINVSAMDVLHEGFIEYLIAQTEENNLSNERVTLELTERDLAECEQTLLTRLNHLKSLGFVISVDDYGIGQSSLSKLKNLPIDELKIDKCFILNLNDSLDDQHIVRSTIALGHDLSLSVVAEGVENKESLDILRSLQCDVIQGYHISKPLKVEQLMEWFKRG